MGLNHFANALWWTCAVVWLLPAGQADAQLLNGEHYSVTGVWDGLEIRAQQIERIDGPQESEPGLISGRVDGLNRNQRFVYIGPLTVAWDDGTQFVGLAPGNIRNGRMLAISVERLPDRSLLARSIAPADGLDQNQIRLRGAIRTGSVADPDDLLFTIFEVPIRLRKGDLGSEPVLATVSEAEPATVASDASAQNAPLAADVPDTSKWRCKWCLYDFGTKNTIEAAVGHASTESFKFGQYTGLEDGAFGVVNWRLDSWNEEGGFWDVDLHALGSERYGAAVSGGRQGRYGVSLGYEQFPVLILDTSVTPYGAADDGTLVLPSGWVRADTTDAMTELPGALQPLELQTEKQRFTLAGHYFLNRNWEVSTKYRHEEKTGQTSFGGAIGGPLIAGLPFQTRSAIIAQPIDFETDTIEASIAFTDRDSHLAFNYSGSLFRENADVVTWQNAFLDPTSSGADFGRSLLRPNNEYHQVSITAGQRLSATTRINGRLAAGTMTQDDAFLPYTVNPDISIALPRQSLDASIDTISGQLRLASSPMRGLDLNAALAYDDRDNGTDQESYDYVVTDTLPSAVARVNLPYSYSRRQANVSAAYRFAPHTRVTLGYSYDERERTFQDIESNTEDSVWGEITLSPGHAISASFKYTTSDRDGSELQLEPEILPATNPLLRKFNMAARERDLATGHINFTPGPAVSIGLTAQVADDEYTESLVGLTESTDTSYTADISIDAGESVNVYGFITHQTIESTQFGSQAFATADWTAVTEDSFDTVGINIRAMSIADRFSFGIEYFYSESAGKFELQSATDPLLPFPDLETQLHHAQAYLDFQATERLAIRFGYTFEDYDSSDWGIDGVTPQTVPSVLTLGERSFIYDAHLLTIGFQYKPAGN